jgi:hypothetical protein
MLAAPGDHAVLRSGSHRPGGGSGPVAWRRSFPIVMALAAFLVFSDAAAAAGRGVAQPAAPHASTMNEPVASAALPARPDAAPPAAVGSRPAAPAVSRAAAHGTASTSATGSTTPAAPAKAAVPISVPAATANGVAAKAADAPAPAPAQRRPSVPAPARAASPATVTLPAAAHAAADHVVPGTPPSKPVARGAVDVAAGVTPGLPANAAASARAATKPAPPSRPAPAHAPTPGLDRLGTPPVADVSPPAQPAAGETSPMAGAPNEGIAASVHASPQGTRAAADTTRTSVAGSPRPNAAHSVASPSRTETPRSALTGPGPVMPAPTRPAQPNGILSLHQPAPSAEPSQSNPALASWESESPAWPGLPMATFVALAREPADAMLGELLDAPSLVAITTPEASRDDAPASPPRPASPMAGGLGSLFAGGGGPGTPTVTTGRSHPGSDHLVLSLLAVLLLATWRALERLALQIPPGTLLSCPTPPG